MKIQIANRENFIRYFLSPVSKVAENVVLKLTDKNISTLVCSSDSSVFLNCICSDISPVNTNDKVTLNLPDVGKFLNAINSINSDSLELLVEDKKIKYISDDISFKVHLLEDGIINAPAVNIDKLKNIDFDCSFDITYDKLQTLIKGSTFATDTNKLYFEMKDGKILADLRDADNEYINSFSTIVSDNIKGNHITKPTPLTFETIRMILGTRFESCKVHFSNAVGVFLFDISNKSYNINYIVSALRR